MKKVFILLLLVLPFVSYAEEDLEHTIKLSVGIGVDDENNPAYGLEYILGYWVSDYFRIGVGTGFSYIEPLYKIEQSAYRKNAAYIPLYLNVKADCIDEGITPYFAVDAGYSFLIPFSGHPKKVRGTFFAPSSGHAQNGKLGVFFAPHFGVDFPVAEGCVFVEVGYKYQVMRFYDGNLNFSQILISFGYSF